MHALLRSRVTFIWLGLVVATVVSWEAVEGLHWVHELRLGGAIVMAIAFLKTRFVLLDFMELREAPVPMRLFGEAWWLLVGLIVIGTVWTGVLGPQPAGAA